MKSDIWIILFWTFLSSSRVYTFSKSSRISTIPPDFLVKCWYSRCWITVVKMSGSILPTASCVAIKMKENKVWKKISNIAKDSSTMIGQYTMGLVYKPNVFTSQNRTSFFIVERLIIFWASAEIELWEYKINITVSHTIISLTFYQVQYNN